MTERDIPLRNKENKENIYLLWSLIAIELFMSFSFLGYVHIEPISITFVYIPVLAAGFLLGPKEAALIGVVFGFASMWKATAFYVGVGDAIFSPAMSGKPIQSIILSIGSRTMFGWIIGWLYQIGKNTRHPLAAALAVTTTGRTIHAFLVYGCMQFLFPEAGFGIKNTWNDIARPDFITFVILANAIIVLCYMLQKSQYIKRIWYRIQMVDQGNTSVSYSKRWLTAVIALVLLSSVSVALYFTNRITRVMYQHGIGLSEEASYDLMHLEMQFLFGMLALCVLLIIFIVIYQKNSSYLYYEAKLDGLTGLLRRKQFFQEGEKALENVELDPDKGAGYFLVLDVDQFKTINDTYGHPMGDRVLQAVADSLRKCFDKKAIIGRLGGDEFVVLVYCPMEEKEMENILDKLKWELRELQFMKNPVTCSVGVLPIKEKDILEKLYGKADKLLYEAKIKGKDQIVFGKKQRKS